MAYTPGDRFTCRLSRVCRRSGVALSRFNGKASRPGFSGRVIGAKLVEIDVGVWVDFWTGVLETSVFGTILIGRNSRNVHHIDVVT